MYWTVPRSNTTFYLSSYQQGCVKWCVRGHNICLSRPVWSRTTARISRPFLDSNRESFALQLVTLSISFSRRVSRMEFLLRTIVFIKVSAACCITRVLFMNTATVCVCVCICLSLFLSLALSLCLLPNCLRYLSIQIGFKETNIFTRLTVSIIVYSAFSNSRLMEFYWLGAAYSRQPAIQRAQG